MLLYSATPISSNSEIFLQSESVFGHASLHMRINSIISTYGTNSVGIIVFSDIDLLSNNEKNLAI